MASAQEGPGPRRWIRNWKSKPDERSELKAFLATASWVLVWLFVPFITFGVVFLLWGFLAAVAMWIGLGVLLPKLPISTTFRELMPHMLTWINGWEIIGEMPGPGADGKRKPCLQCHHPHGVVAINPTAQGGIDISVRPVGAPNVFRMPFCRQMMEMGGAISSDRDTIKKHMALGEDLGIIPGGIEEVVLADPKVERSYILKRKGFIKYALEMGYDVVPIYHLGETQLFVHLWPLGEPFFLRMRMHLVEMLNIPTGLGIGWRWCWPLPRRDMKSITIIGDVLELPKLKEGEKVSSEQVDKYHAEYVKRLVDLYNRNRHRVPGYENKDLQLW